MQAGKDLLVSAKAPALPTPPSLTIVAVTTADAGPPTISHPGRRSLASLGFGELRFVPASGSDGLALPINLDLPRTQSGRWFWWVDLHAVIQLDATSPVGSAMIAPGLAHVGGPGPEFAGARNSDTGQVVLVDVARRRAGGATIEVRQRAILGGSPDPRQSTQLTFALRTYAATSPRLLSVTICGDTTVEVTDTPPAGPVVQQPALRGTC